jgi:hypothetical protein
MPALSHPDKFTASDGEKESASEICLFSLYCIPLHMEGGGALRKL